MKTQMSTLTQSKYYSAVFNAAIFDGPLRLYFAQYQEPLALKLYFKLQDGLKLLVDRARAENRELPTLFIMLYPTEELFKDCFEPASAQQKMDMAPLGDDYILGIQGPLKEEDYDVVVGFIERMSGLERSLEAVASL